MEDNKTVIKLERHEWPDEKEKRLESEKKRKKDKRKRRNSQVFVLILGVILGLVISQVYERFQPIQVENNNQKISEMKSLLENQWFFADNFEDIDQELIDKALYGMSDFEDVDKHTGYMSVEEVEEFQSSINMGYVGIGVQYSVSGDLFIVTRVFVNSPAEKAGVMPGDIIDSVDGVSVEGLESSDIRDLVLGETNTVVNVGFIRGSEEIIFPITRGEVVNTVFGEMLDEDTGYLEIYSFGNTTYDESRDYLTKMTEAGMENLIIDLRDNGGGYLTSLINMSGLFLPDGTVAMQQVYPDGDVDLIFSDGETFEKINNIVILINENSASASEVLTLALKEQRDDVTLMGVTSYGKGTVQVTAGFSDGSAIKYTTSKWTSPNGIWINEIGINPDIEVELDDILNETIPPLEDEMFIQDDVSEFVKIMQDSLDFIGYEVDRTDGYFSSVTEEILIEYQYDKGIEANGVLNDETYTSLITDVKTLYVLDKNYDRQLQAALGELNG